MRSSHAGKYAGHGALQSVMAGYGNVCHQTGADTRVADDMGFRVFLDGERADNFK